MPGKQRAQLATTGAGPASSEIAVSDDDPALGNTNCDIGRAVDALIERSSVSNTALMRGDIDEYRAVVSYSDDFTLMSPFGGAPTHGRDLTNKRWTAMGRFFRNGTFSQQVVQSYGTADMVVLALIERCDVEIGGLPKQEWPLRVTLVYRRDGCEWRLAHRHADPLVAGVSWRTAAELARGDIK